MSRGKVAAGPVGPSKASVEAALGSAARALGRLYPPGSGRSGRGPRDEAVQLIAWAAGSSTAWVRAHPEAILSREIAVRLADAVVSRSRGEPMAYVTGEAHFLDLVLAVGPSVLVPRPETELLAEWAVARGMEKGHRRILDVGTGAGGLAIALARALPRAKVVATDISPAALRMAAANVRRHDVANRVQLVAADLLSPGSEHFDLVVANVPYVGLAERGAVSPSVARFEPALALFAGPDGLLLIRRLLARLPGRLAPGADVGLEIGVGQGAPVLRLVRRSLGRRNVGLRSDYAGRPRLVTAESR